MRTSIHSEGDIENQDGLNHLHPQSKQSNTQQILLDNNYCAPAEQLLNPSANLKQRQSSINSDQFLRTSNKSKLAIKLGKLKKIIKQDVR